MNCSTAYQNVFPTFPFESVRSQIVLHVVTNYSPLFMFMVLLMLDSFHVNATLIQFVCYIPVLIALLGDILPFSTFSGHKGKSQTFLPPPSTAFKCLPLVLNLFLFHHIFLLPCFVSSLLRFSQPLWMVDGHLFCQKIN